MWPRNRGRGRSNSGSNSRGGQWNHRGSRSRGGVYNRGFRRGGFRDSYKKPNEKLFHTDSTYHHKKSSENVNMIEKLNEIDIGVTEFISTLEGFTGVLKSRYSDFHVNEIDMDGKIAKLTNLSVPKDPEPVQEEEDDDVLVNRYRIEQLPIETWDRIHKMIQSNDKNEIIEVDVTSMTKEDRTKIHEAVKTVFGQKIVGSTITKDDKKFVTIKLFNRNERVDRREKWPKSRGGEYVYFLVYKEYTDTIEANIQISESLRMRPSNFCYAGVKDRRAKTTQWFCVRKIDPARIAERTKYFRNINVGNFCYKKETLKLGQLQGNRFRIALRNVTAENEIIGKALESLRDHGFINYYGLQRFGNCKEIPTHEIGIQLLKGNWKEAVNLILKPRKYEQDKEVSAAKQLYEKTGDAAKAYGKLEKKRNRCIEGKLLGGLMKHSANDFVNALENVPRNMRLLYIHAYQSLIWNQIASRRIKEFGLKPIIGDLVVEDDVSENFESMEGIEDDNGENETNEINEKEVNQKHIKVKILTEIDLPNYSIYDIVLPLPGYDISYPSNIAKDWYEELLTQHGLTLEMPKQKVKTYTLSGAYRKILGRVTNFSWKLMHYNDSTANLIRSDYEELMDKPEPTDVPNGKLKALILDFCLKPCCYATMALREIMKMDTSVETHMNFDNAMNKSTQTSESTNIEEQTKSNLVTMENNASENEDIKSEILSEKMCESTIEDICEIKKEETCQRKIEENTNLQTSEKRKLPDEDENEVKKIKTELAD